jgi:hypothetical protein
VHIQEREPPCWKLRGAQRERQEMRLERKAGQILWTMQTTTGSLSFVLSSWEIIGEVEESKTVE